jgi:hypothetical protein
MVWETFGVKNGAALVELCDRIGVDLVAAMSDNVQLNAQRYPVALSKGRHSRPPDRTQHFWSVTL